MDMQKSEEIGHASTIQLGRRKAALAIVTVGLASMTAGRAIGAVPPALDESLALPVKHLTRDGVRLAYVEKGTGEPSILLVHGMTGEHSSFLYLLHHLSKNHRVVAVDLRGHGDSDAPEGEYSDAVFNDDLVFMCNELGLKNPVAMGHSFGGSTLLHLAQHRPGFLGGLVLLDSGVRTTAAKEAELQPVYDDPDPEALAKFLAERMNSPWDPPELRSRRKNKKYPPDHVIESMQKTVVGFDAASAAAEVTLPALFLLATRHFSDPETLGRLGPNWLVGQVVASGHSIHLVVPEQVHPMIDRFLQIHWGS